MWLPVVAVAVPRAKKKPKTLPGTAPVHLVDEANELVAKEALLTYVPLLKSIERDWVHVSSEVSVGVKLVSYFHTVIRIELALGPDALGAKLTP